MTISIINEELKNVLIAAMRSEESLQLPECVTESKGGFSIKYDELQMEINHENLWIHFVYKKEVVGSNIFQIFDDKETVTKHSVFMGSIIVDNLALLMDSGEKVNQMEIEFSITSKIRLNLFDVEFYPNKKPSKTLINQFDLDQLGIWSISGFTGYLPCILD